MRALVVVALLLTFPACARAADPAAWSGLVQAGQVRTVPAGVCEGQRPSDVHAYTLAGRPLRQSRARWGNITFRSRSGRVRVGFVPVNDDWFGQRGRARVKVWCG